MSPMDQVLLRFHPASIDSQKKKFRKKRKENKKIKSEN